MDLKKIAIETGTKLQEMGLDSEEQMMQLIMTSFKPPRNGILNIRCPQCPKRFKREFGENQGHEYVHYISHWLDHVKEDRDGTDNGRADSESPGVGEDSHPEPGDPSQLPPEAE